MIGLTEIVNEEEGMDIHERIGNECIALQSFITKSPIIPIQLISLSASKSLRILNLNHATNNNITDESLQIISIISSLHTLAIPGSRCTIKGLPYFSSLKELRRLDLSYCTNICGGENRFSPVLMHTIGTHCPLLEILNIKRGINHEYPGIVLTEFEELAERQLSNQLTNIINNDEKKQIICERCDEIINQEWEEYKHWPSLLPHLHTLDISHAAVLCDNAFRRISELPSLTALIMRGIWTYFPECRFTLQSLSFLSRIEILSFETSDCFYAKMSDSQYDYICSLLSLPRLRHLYLMINCWIFYETDLNQNEFIGAVLLSPSLRRITITHFNDTFCDCEDDMSRTSAYDWKQLFSEECTRRGIIVEDVNEDDN